MLSDRDKPPIGAPCNGCGLCCRITVCSAGSYALGLVPELGDRAPGPCPALVADGHKWVCGIMRHPHDWLTPVRSVTQMRGAFGTLIGAGAGCDEIGDEPGADADARLLAIQQDYLARTGENAIRDAFMIVAAARKL